MNKTKNKNVLFMSAFAVNTHHIKNRKKINENTLCTCECLHFVHKKLHTPTKRCSSPFLKRPYICMTEMTIKFFDYHKQTTTFSNQIIHTVQFTGAQYLP